MKINIQKGMPVLFFMLAVILLLWMGDESAKPLSVNGKDLSRQGGSTEDTYAIIQEEDGASAAFLTSSSYLLNKGSYAVGLAYNCDSSGSILTLYDNGKILGSYSLDPGGTYNEYPVQLDKASEDFKFVISFSGSGTLRVFHASLIPEGRFYHDTEFLTALFLIGCAILFLWKRALSRKTLSTKSAYTGLFLAGAGLLACLPYLRSGLYWAIDLSYHLIRIEGIKNGLLSGQFPVVIYPEALCGNGYLDSMYPSLFLYIPAVLRLLGVSMADSHKFLMMAFSFATAFLTYHCVKTIGQNRQAAMLAALLYTCCPYRFTNLYARGAIGEYMAMTFFPLLFTGLYHVLSGDRRKWGFLTLGMTGLLQCHMLSVSLGGIICLLFGLLYLKEVFWEKRYLEILKAASVSLLLNIGFLIPFFYFYRKGNLWVDSLNISSYSEATLNLPSLLGTISTGDYHMLTLGLPLAVLAVIGAAHVLVERKEDRTEGWIRCLLCLGVVLFIMMLSLFPSWKLMDVPLAKTVLMQLQFPWRLLGPVSLLFAITGSICLFRTDCFRPYASVVFVVLAGICLLGTVRFQDEDFGYFAEKQYTSGHEAKVVGIPKGAATIVYPYEWRPKNTVDAGINTSVTLSDDTRINLTGCSRNGVTTTIDYACTTDGQFIEIPVIHYPGYQAFDENGAELSLDTGYNNRIRVPLAGDGSPHRITVSYRIPWFFTAAAWTSILTALVWLAWTLYHLYKKKGLQHVG